MLRNRLSRAKTAKSRAGRTGLLARAPPQGSGKFPIVGIGASAGGLDACTKLVAALPPETGMAFVLVQHLDPTHESLMPELLARHTRMTAVQAEDGMPLQREHLYIIPPGTYLSVAKTCLRISEPKARHGARLPFDFLLRSLAEEYGERAICVILSGTGTDGSLGLKAIKEKGGLVIAQDPDEAAYDGMPRSAIMTGAVDLVLPLARISEALVKFNRRMAATRVVATGRAVAQPPPDWLAEIIELLRAGTSHDFRLYKDGTLRRRVERRMAMSAVETDDMARYLDLLRNDAQELNHLATDLLINVTGFFRDKNVFEMLSETIIPALAHRHSAGQPLRVWIAACSTGEEAYSLAMLFREAITAAKHEIKLQIFASDVDAEAVATAREGLYPETIAAEVSPDRLTRFFSKDDHGYRVLPELRATIVFAVHDVLTDPPFSNLDLISCRNLLIYLRSEAQEKVIDFFHFALREGGVLLLGTAETVGGAEGRFEVISKAERLYRHVGRSRPGEIGLLFGAGIGARPPAQSPQSARPTRQAALAEGCRRLVLESYAPAAVLISRKLECLYSMGPTELYLRVPQGHPNYDLLAMVGPHMRIRLRAAIHQSILENTRVLIPGGRTSDDGKPVSFSIAVQTAVIDGEDLLLICFIDEAVSDTKLPRKKLPHDVEQVADLEQRLEATQTELQTAIQSLETSNEEQKAINEEALSVNEEYQSTNEELLTSKEELQSLNEELSALNSQLQETLERQRTTASDLQNILYSTHVATIFLDLELNIRFFTPATKSLFNIIPSDIGRPLSDLNPVTADTDLLIHARAVLEALIPIEREIQARDGFWYIRRVLPYRAQNDGVEGVVVTFVDITERKHVADALEVARREAQQANAAKSRFLAAASHDLRQPLQALSLMRSVLTRKIQDNKKDEALALVARLDETSSAMSGMLDTLLDINQLEAGTVRPEPVSFPINDLLGRLRDEFAYHAGAQGLHLRVVPCSLWISSDPRLLEQMIRNLLSNSLKYTGRGKVLLGCRRRRGMVSIEVWDTGVGIPASDLHAIFEEYHQLDNAARERSRGLGLGLSIVQRLARLLGHPVHVRSQPGKGSVFSIDILGLAEATSPSEDLRLVEGSQNADSHRAGSILIIEDDGELRDLLEMILKEEGHRPMSAPDGPTALALLAQDAFHPDLILADYNLPNGMDGLLVAAKVRENFDRQTPVIILTGDISTNTLKRIAGQDCVQLNKPVKATELTETIRLLLASIETSTRSPVAHQPGCARPSEKSVVFVVDDDSHVRAGIRDLLEADGRTVEDFASCEDFLAAHRPGRQGCLLVDAYLPGMTGLELLKRLQDGDRRLPAIMITGSSDVPMAVEAMKSGASDFIEKPIGRKELLASVNRAFEQSQDAAKLSAFQRDAAERIAALTVRQREIMDLVLAGHPSKNIAADLKLSQRTVEHHRAEIMKRTGTKSLPALAHLALAATTDAMT